MKIYDYRTEQENEPESHESAMLFFCQSVLPILQDYAEMTSSLLIMDESDKGRQITATLKNSMGFDITESCKTIRGLLAMTENISISVENDDVVLTLIFSYEFFS